MGLKVAGRAAWGLGVVALLGAARLAWAGPLDTAVVDKGATWIFHLDVEAGVASTCGRFLTDEMKKDPESQKITAMFGLDPTRDIKSMTVYGFKPGEDDGLAVLVTSAAADGLAKKVEAENAKDFVSHVQGDMTLLSWRNEEREWHLAIKPRGEERVVLLASTSQILEQGLAVVTGGKASLKTAEPATVEPMLQKPSKGSILFVAARGLANCPKFKASVFKEARALLIDVGEEDAVQGAGKDTFAKITITTADEPTATSMQQVVQGLIGMASMMARNRGVKDVPECLQGIKVAAEGTSLVISARENSEELVGQLKALGAVIDAGDGHVGVSIKQTKGDEKGDEKAPEKKDAPRKDQEK
jgi:hypothetical protein